MSIALLLYAQFSLKHYIVGLLCVIFSCVLGSLAAREGSLWWMLVPLTAVAFSVFVIWVIFHLRL